MNLPKQIRLARLLQLEGSMQQGTGLWKVDEGDGPFADFYKLLQRTAAADTDRAITLLRTDLDLAFGVQPDLLAPTVDSVLQQVNPTHPSFGWVLFWKANCSVESDIQACLPVAYRAARLGVLRRDEVLQISAGYLLGAVQITLGYLQAARQTATACLAIADRAHDPILRSRALSLNGTLAMYSGMPKKGLDLMEEATDGFSSTRFELACHRGLTALYLASDGHRSEAEHLLDEVEPIAASSHHHWLGQVSKLTRGLLADRPAENDAPRNSQGEAVRAPLSHGMSDQDRSFERLQRSRKLRDKMKMAYSAWDRRRTPDFNR